MTLAFDSFLRGDQEWFRIEKTFQQFGLSRLDRHNVPLIGEVRHVIFLAQFMFFGLFESKVAATWHQMDT